MKPRNRVLPEDAISDVYHNAKRLGLDMRAADYALMAEGLLRGFTELLAMARSLRPIVPDPLANVKARVNDAKRKGGHSLLSLCRLRTKLADLAQYPDPPMLEPGELHQMRSMVQAVIDEIGDQAHDLQDAGEDLGMYPKEYR